MSKSTPGELVPANAADIEKLDPKMQEVAVTAFLTDARDRLALALEATGPHAVAQIKAEVAVVAEMTKQLDLSKECRDDATEMVRRAEYALAKAIRKGQEDGTVRTQGQGSRQTSPRGSEAASPYDFASRSSLSNNPTTGRPGIMAFADIDNGDLESAMAAAKSEGDLSRTNVVRKIKGENAKPEHKGRGTEKRQLKAAENASMQLRGMLDGLTAIFDGGFEKTFTPEIAAEYARKLRAEHRRLATLINQIDSHGKGN